MRKALSLVVSVGVFSSLFSGGISGSATSFNKGCFFNKRSEVTKDEKKCHENKTEKKVDEKNKSGGTLSKIVKFVLSLAINVCLARGLQSFTDGFNITDSKLFSDRTKNLFSVTKKGLSPEKILVGTIKNPQAMKDISNMLCYVPLYKKIFSIANGVLSMFGLPDCFSIPCALYAGFKSVLTNVKTPQQAALESVVGYFVNDGIDENEKGIAKLPGRKRT